MGAGFMSDSNPESLAQKLYCDALNCINTEDGWFLCQDDNTNSIKTKVYVKNLVPINFLTIKKLRFFVVKQKNEIFEKDSLYDNSYVSIVVSELSNEENLMYLIDYCQIAKKDNYQLKESYKLFNLIQGLCQSEVYFSWASRDQQSASVVVAHRALVLNNIQPLHYYFDPQRNPVLNSPDDITEDLLQRISDNNLDSLTINYEFTYLSPLFPFAETEREKFVNSLRKTNPFIMAYMRKKFSRVEFEVIFTDKVRSLSGAFVQLSQLTYVNIKDTSNITEMVATFFMCENFNQPIEHWNTSKVTTMCLMFCGAKSFNQPIGNWDTSKVTNMAHMFAGAESFNQPIDNWNTSNVTNMWSMFLDAKSFNQPLRNWNTSKVSNMAAMFGNAESFNQPIGNWDTSKVENMEDMFSGCPYNCPKPQKHYDKPTLKLVEMVMRQSNEYSNYRSMGNNSGCCLIIAIPIVLLIIMSFLDFFV